MNRHHPSDEERRKWQDPEAILAGIGLGEGMTFIDIGCGDGFFALPAARAVGAAGRVLGVDVDGQALESLKSKAGAEGLGNIEVVAAAAEETVLCEGCGDIVFFGIDLHDFRDPSAVLSNARAAIKTGGKLVDLDWKKEEMPLGPPLRIRFSEERASSLIETAGFTIESIELSGAYHYLIIARP